MIHSSHDRKQAWMVFLYLETVHMMPKWLSLWSEFRSRVRFVLHSPDKMEWLSLKSSCSHQIRYGCTTCPRPHDLQFFFRFQFRFAIFFFIFSLHCTRMKFQFSKTNFNSDWKLEWTHSRITYCNKMSDWYHVTKYRKIYEDGMNLFQTENHSRS